MKQHSKTLRGSSLLCSGIKGATNSPAEPRIETASTWILLFILLVPLLLVRILLVRPRLPPPSDDAVGGW